MNLPPLPFLVLDTETTGLFPRVHKIVELAFLRMEKGEVTDQYEQLYAIDDALPPHVQVLTHIRPEDIEGKPMLHDHLDDLRARIGSDTLLVGQNLGFDIDMLRAEGLDLREYPWIDTSMLASLLFPELASYSLGYMSTTLGLRHDPVHRALGDVRATLELFRRIWERIQELPEEYLAPLRTTFARSTTGHRYLAEYLPKKSRALSLPWSLSPKEFIDADTEKFPLPSTAPGSPLLLEDSLNPHALHHLMNAVRGEGKTTWIAVKNLEATLRRIHLPDDVCVLHPPVLLLDPDAAKRLQEQSTFTADEATLTVKLHWFPARVREDIQVHGGERDVWNGKLACADLSPSYTSQFERLSSAVLLDHRQLLQLLAQKEAGGGHAALRPEHIIVIDDASMLEDTATKAYGHFLTIDDLRAASIGHDSLMKFTDLLALWAEKVRGQDDIHLLQTSDFQRRETKGLREQLDGFLADDTLPPRLREHLRSLANITGHTDDNMVTWIESRQQRLTLHTAPADVARLLTDNLFSRFAAVLLSPPGFKSIPETTTDDAAVYPSPLPPTRLQISFPTGQSATEALENPPPGKTVLLLPSKRLIEGHFIRFAERLETRGITFICQGLSGGQGRMEAEFSAAADPAFLLLTPWTYEGFELPLGTVDHLIMDTLPFDHPSDLLMQVRSKHFRDPFTEYVLPRLKLRLFRLFRTLCRHRKPSCDVRILDKRIHEKKYGGEVRTYLEQFSSETPPTAGGQMKMF